MLYGVVSCEFVGGVDSAGEGSEEGVRPPEGGGAMA